MLKIDSLDHNGRGIAHLSNKVVFVENALEGEIVEINILKDKKNYIEANVSRYIQKSDERIENLCPYYEVCGGCDILHMSYKKQLEFKQNKMRNIVDKYLDKSIKVNKIVKSGNQFEYRNKVTFQVKNKLGFYKNKTNDIVRIDKCLLASKKINDSIDYLNKLDLTKINKITCRSTPNELMVIIDSNSNIDISPIKDIAKVQKVFELVYGNPNIYNIVGPYKYIISPESFFQINDDICKKLYDKIYDETKDSKNILDLYCGTGSIGIYVSKNKNVLGIEINKSAINDANINKELNDIKNISFICGDSGKESKKINFNPDTIIVDPPRSGLDSITINNILELNPQKIIYVSCDPMTLVRDLNILKNNYSIKEITPFDMFPNTKHVENMCVLERK